MQKYRFIDKLTSDVMFEAYGKNLKEVFENAALAMFSIVCAIKKVEPKEKESFKIKADRIEELMINWLQGLIAIVDTEQKFFSKFKIKKINETELNADLYGEPISPEKGGTVVKAITLYKYKFEKTDKGYVVRVSMDI